MCPTAHYDPPCIMGHDKMSADAIMAIISHTSAMQKPVC